MTPEKQEVLWEKLVELKETPGKDGEAPEKRGEPRNTKKMRRASIKAGVHQKNKKLLYDTREIRSSSEKAGGIEGNTRKSWRNTRKKWRTCKGETGFLETKNI